MATSIPAFPKPSVAISVTATAKATPITIATIRRAMHAALVKVTATNIMPAGTAVREQVWVGVRKYGDTGATWEPFMAPILFDGEISVFECNIILSEIDELVAYASAGAKINLLPEYTEFKA